jgi:hypothetical protein
MAPVLIEISAGVMGDGGVVTLTPSLLRKVRRAVGWRVQDLANASGVPPVTIYAHEARRRSGRMHRLTNAAVLNALRKAGVAFRDRKRRRLARKPIHGVRRMIRVE